MGLILFASLLLDKDFLTLGPTLFKSKIGPGKAREGSLCRLGDLSPVSFLFLNLSPFFFHRLGAPTADHS